MTPTEQHRLATAPAAPREVAYAIRALFVVAAIHLVALALVITHHDVLTAAVAAHHPDWSPDRVGQADAGTSADSSELKATHRAPVAQ